MPIKSARKGDSCYRRTGTEPQPVARSMPDEESEESTTNDNADNVGSSAHKRKAEDALDEASEDESTTELGDPKEIMPSRRIYKDMPQW